MPLSATTPPLIADHIASARYFFFELKPPPGEPLHVVCGGLEQCLPQYHVRRDRFAYHSIEFVLRGRGQVELDGRQHDLRPGSVFSYSPKTPHTISTARQAPLVKYFVDFTGPRARHVLASAGLPAGTLSFASQPAPVMDLFNLLISHGQAGTAHHRKLCRSTLELIALHLATPAWLPRSSTAQPVDRSAETFLAVRHYMTENYRSVHSVADVAAQCKIDPSYLCRLFARHEQMTPHAFITRRKMQHAAHLLVRSGLMVKQAAAAVGFADPYHFSRAFKRFHGIAPVEFARRSGTV
jgi:AraC-like DNA-binding protein